MPPVGSPALCSLHSFSLEDISCLYSLSSQPSCFQPSFQRASLPLPDWLTLHQQSSSSSPGYSGGLKPNMDSPDVYAYVKDLMSLGILTCLWARVYKQQEGCALLLGLHVVLQACLRESQQMCVYAFSARKRDHHLPAQLSPFPILTAPQQPRLFPSFPPAPFSTHLLFSSLSQSFPLHSSPSPLSLLPSP